MRSGGWFGGKGRGRLRLRLRLRRRERGRRGTPKTLADLPEGGAGVLESLDLPEDVALRLMELGFLPGTTIVACKTAPGGGAQVFRVDGGEIALRRETALKLRLKLPE